MKKIAFAAIAVLIVLFSDYADAKEKQRIGVHDPVMIEENNTWYLFCTGRGIEVLSSPDLQNWTRLSPVFEEVPAWVKQEIPNYKGSSIWAPDISYHNRQYYIYYSVSAFGRNTSCIGVATNKTLNPADPEFKWIDHGMVVKSVPGETNWNAIDPNLIIDDRGTPWLTFGSFWNGIQQIKMNANLFEIDGTRDNIVTIASRKTEEEIDNQPDPGNYPLDAGSSQIEAPFMFKNKDYYYLFVSWDRCCAGPESTYKIAIGRSLKPHGPFVDKEGKQMLYCSGTILLQGDETDWYAQGHNAVVRDAGNGKVYLVAHAYDRHDIRGASKLRILELNWDNEGWPVIGKEIY
ncbi:family 43 glycosylhydrolase [Sunxiuqinia sp. A32]|uniref:family 43 glycosylhydrolase n=1 Tax=Sunxiuqinia sp. A32 TaxID=3461496 RepID=UPI004045968A